MLHLLNQPPPRPTGLSVEHRRGVAQAGSAPVLGTGSRGFESRRPDHRKASTESERVLTEAKRTAISMIFTRGNTRVEDSRT